MGAKRQDNRHGDVSETQRHGERHIQFMFNILTCLKVCAAFACLILYCFVRLNIHRSGLILSKCKKMTLIMGQLS